MRTILYNGHLYQERGQFVSALLIEDGTILQAGSDASILAHQTSETRLIDLQGKTGLPGFNDSHLHFYMSAVAFQTVQLYGLTSIEALIAQGKAFVSAHPNPTGQAVFGRGWNQDYFTGEARLVNRTDLDQISTDFPIVFSRACGHVVTANSKALAVLGITASTPQVEGGQFDLDEQGNPNGIFRENAIGLLSSLQVPLSAEDRIGLLRQVSAIANRYGITSVQTNDLTIGTEEGEAIEAAYHDVAAHEPTVRITHQVSFSDLPAFQERIQNGYHPHENDFNRYGPLKLFVDGSLGARTAKMRTPYADDPTTQGIECMSPEILDRYVALADAAGVQIAVHAIGDGAMAQILDAYQKVITDGNMNRHGIVHCQITDMDLLRRFQALDILAYVQPIFLHYDMHIVESRVGQQLASTSYAFRTMEELGLHVAYGTDSPVEGLNVFHNIHCAINRQDLNSTPVNGFYPHEKVDLETAIDDYTIGSAYASFEENRKGRLLPGYMADLVIVDQPLFDLDYSQIKDVEVTMTMVDGNIVYTRS